MLSPRLFDKVASEGSPAVCKRRRVQKSQIKLLQAARASPLLHALYDGLFGFAFELGLVRETHMLEGCGQGELDDGT